MKKVLIAACCFFLISTFTGCINIFEDLIINANGGGHFVRKVDLSEMMDMMKSLKDADGKDSNAAKKEETGPDESDGLSKSMKDDEEALKGIKGISNVRRVEDTVKQIYTLEFDFVNDAALNEAINKTGEKKVKADPIYTITKSSVNRSDYDMMKSLNKNEETDKEAAELMEAFLGQIKYHISVTLPGKVSSVTNKKAEISDDKKTVTVEATMQDMSEKKITPAMKINFK